MAILTAAQLTDCRQNAAASLAAAALAVNFTKTQVNAALQACEDYFEDTARAGFGSAIESAAPGVFTAGQKKRIVAFYLLKKIAMEGV